MILTAKICFSRISTFQSPHLFLLSSTSRILSSSQCCRSISSKKHPEMPSSGLKGGSKMNSVDPNWITVYRFPFIVPARVFSRSKLHLTVVSTLSMPYSTFLYQQGMVDFETAVVSSGLVIFSTALLFAFGQIFRRMIGSIYISENEKQVRFSHLTFFGNRQETVHDIEDVLPLNDSNDELNNMILRVSFLDTESNRLKKDSLYMSLRFGGITDQRRFERVFGG